MAAAVDEALEAAGEAVFACCCDVEEGTGVAVAGAAAAGCDAAAVADDDAAAEAGGWVVEEAAEAGVAAVAAVAGAAEFSVCRVVEDGVVGGLGDGDCVCASLAPDTASLNAEAN